MASIDSQLEPNCKLNGLRELRLKVSNFANAISTGEIKQIKNIYIDTKDLKDAYDNYEEIRKIYIEHPNDESVQEYTELLEYILLKHRLDFLEKITNQ
jgi:CRISPR/Cas system-associated endonuclease Cas3-HD